MLAKRAVDNKIGGKPFKKQGLHKKAGGTKYNLRYILYEYGAVAERLKATVLKTVLP